MSLHQRHGSTVVRKSDPDDVGEDWALVERFVFANYISQWSRRDVGMQRRLGLRKRLFCIYGDDAQVKTLVVSCEQ